MNTPEEKMSVLLCEDDENLGMLLREYLQTKGYDTELCPDGEAGYRAFTQNKYDLCVLDVMMPKRTASAWRATFVRLTRRYLSYSLRQRR